MVGDELLARLQESVTEYKRTSSSVEFTGTGEYYDEEDLKKRYEGKPEQLKNLLANTKTYYCPVKQVWLFEDVTYKRVARDAEETGRVEKRKVQMIPKDDGEAAGNEPEERATKKNKGNKNKDNKSGGSQLPKFKAGEKKKMLRKMEGMTGKRLQLLDLCCKAKSEKLKALVPGYVLSASEKIVDEAITFTSEFERILASDHGDSKDLLERIDRNTEALNEAAARLKCQVEPSPGEEPAASPTEKIEGENSATPSLGGLASKDVDKMAQEVLAALGEKKEKNGKAAAAPAKKKTPKSKAKGPSKKDEKDAKDEGPPPKKMKAALPFPGEGGASAPRGGNITRPQLGGPAGPSNVTRPQLGGGVAGAASGCPDTKPQMGVPGMMSQAGAVSSGFGELLDKIFDGATLGSESAKEAELAEVLLECTYSANVDVSQMPMKHKCLALRGKEQPWAVGRQQQPNFFARLIPDETTRTLISRSHVVLSLEHQALHVKKLSPNAVKINGWAMSKDEEVPLVSGTQMDFCGRDNATAILCFRILQRDAASGRSGSKQQAQENPRPANVPSKAWWFSDDPGPFSLLCARSRRQIARCLVGFWFKSGGPRQDPQKALAIYIQRDLADLALAAAECVEHAPAGTALMQCVAQRSPGPNWWLPKSMYDEALRNASCTAASGSIPLQVEQPCTSCGEGARAREFSRAGHQLRRKVHGRKRV
eukprot:g18090.t1